MTPEVREKFLQAGLDLNVGDHFIDEGSPERVIRISKITVDERTKDKEPRIYYDISRNWELTEWSHYGSTELSMWKHNRYLKIDKPLHEFIQEGKDVIAGKIDIAIYDMPETDSLNEETALIHRSSKEGLNAIREAILEKKAKAELIRAAVGFEMEKKKAELEHIRRGLYEMVEIMEKKVKKIMRVITTIEIYLGINEELFQILDGEKAPSDTPITFRQMVLFMDEETGHWEGGGLDFTNISWFDHWLTVPENLQQVFPEKKGVVVFRPRRSDKNYETDNIQYSSGMNDENRRRTYLLIRNGDCLFRIYTDKLIIYDRLFPLRSELQNMMQEMQDETSDYRKEKNQEKIEDKMYQYKKRALLLQGLIDRSEVFHPLPAEKVNIFKMDELGDKVQFIYDDEATLPTGRLSFKEWKNIMNDKIKNGSRVLLTGHYVDRYSYRRYNAAADDPFGERFYLAKNGNELKNIPDLPPEGVYTVEEFSSTWAREFRETAYYEEIEKLKAEGKKFTAEGVKKGYYWNVKYPDEKTGSRDVFIIRYYSDKKELTIMYKPGDKTAWGWGEGGEERKFRTRFKIYPEDEFVFNYDQIEIEDIDFYLKSRVDRPNYLGMMPILEKIKEHRLKELENESHFIKFVVLKNYKTLAPLTENDIEGRVIEAVNWWKFKNQWKRPINKDDTLALRMIERRILSPNYHTFEKY